MKSHPTSAPAGFTLLELSVVLGLIALALTVTGVAVRPAAGTSLRSAQAIVAEMIAAAEAQAALGGGRVAVLVDANPRSDSFLHRLALAVETEPERWRVVEPTTDLPADVFVVPTSSIAGVTAMDKNGMWPASCRSSLESVSDVMGGSASGSGYARLAPFREGGVDGSTTEAKRIVLAVGRRSADGMRFTNSASACGLVISEYGVAAMANEPGDFEF